MTIIIFIIVLAILILVHEFGHFIIAKRAGLVVEEFGFGFPPRIFSFKKGEIDDIVDVITRFLGENFHIEYIPFPNLSELEKSLPDKNDII